jgi:hypothetical protein
MRQELKTHLLIDDRIDSYKSFFDHDWAKKFFTLTDGTQLEEAAFILATNWKSTVNSQFMPWLMMSSFKSFEEEYLRPNPTLTETVTRGLMQLIPGRAASFLSSTQQKQLAQLIADLGAQFKQANEVVQQVELDDLKPQKVFHDFLYGRGGSELQMSVFGSQRASYALFFFEYENFVTACVGLARKKDPAMKEEKYRVYKSATLFNHFKAAFDEALANYCLTDQPVKVGRIVRNALSHNGGRMDQEDRAEVRGVIEEIDGFARIMPEHNRVLFKALKERAMRLAERTVAFPHVAKACSTD